MKRQLLLIKLMLSFFWNSNLLAETMDESALLSVARENPPTLQQIALSIEAKKLAQSLQDVQYSSQVYGAANYTQSSENPLIEFAPVFSPASDLSVGYRKVYPKGINVDARLYGEQVSFDGPAGPVNDASRIGMSVGAEIDLWKNLWGRLDNLNIATKQKDLELTEARAKLSVKEFEMNIRKIYWSIIALDASYKLTSNLVESSKKQLNDAIARSRQGISDNGDIARNKAQVKSRESSLLFFDYQRRLLVSQLQALLPSLKNKTIEFSSDLGQVETRVQACMKDILATSDAPTNYSSYENLIKKIKAFEEAQIAEAEWTDSMDVKLKAQLTGSSVGPNGYDDAINDFDDNSGVGAAVGVEVSMPLDNKATTVEEIQSKIAKLSADAEIQNLTAILSAEHAKTRHSLELLTRALVTQTDAAQQLKVAMANTERKYSQARVDLNSLILEQDSYFNSKLAEIDTKQQTIHLLYDYFKTFDAFPCALNQL